MGVMQQNENMMPSLDALSVFKQISFLSHIVF